MGLTMKPKSRSFPNFRIWVMNPNSFCCLKSQYLWLKISAEATKKERILKKKKRAKFWAMNQLKIGKNQIG